jgi:hypothetical protein
MASALLDGSIENVARHEQTRRIGGVLPSLAGF